jgi:hypothetical protein
MIVFLPYVDSNHVTFMYQNYEVEEEYQQCKFPEVELSTIINAQEDFMALIKNRYIIFDRNGQFRYFMKF